VPFVVASEEWAEIEAGLAQRAELLDLVLRDIYGDQEVVRLGLVPPELVFEHRGYQRPARGVPVLGRRHLVNYAADLARRPDGRVVVLADRTQNPTGAGYAIENRRVMNRVFPSMFRDARVHRLSGYLRSMRAALAEQVAGLESEDRIVVLTPGPYNETYFEQALLATTLGYPLVEAADLTVRNGRVWLRSLGRLEPVAGILRRVDDEFCDPLELRPDSLLGVPGLLEAARRGHVAIVNPIGAGVLENPGLLPYLPGLARHFLGVELRSTSATTWWCGDADRRAEVLSDLGAFVLKPIARASGHAPVFGSDLDADEREAMRLRIERDPTRWVGQEAVEVSHVPSLTEAGLGPRRAVLRTFLVARADSYDVMAGGLTRVGVGDDDLVITNQTGGSSKDTWVLASEPEERVSPWMVADHVAGPGSLPSRAGENLFWVGRYAERAEATARLIRVVLDRVDDPDGRVLESEQQRLRLLLHALALMTETPTSLADDGVSSLAHPEPELLACVLGPSPGTFASTLRYLLASAYSVRDQLSGDTWQVVNDLEEDAAALARVGDNLLAVRAVVERLLRSLLALSGLVAESMQRGAAWAFVDSGRRIERALLLVQLTRTTLVPAVSRPVEESLVESFLGSVECLMAYRRRYHAHLAVAQVLELVLADAGNPRSLRYQLDCLERALAGFPRPDNVELSAEERLVLDARTHLRLADTAHLSVRSVSTDRREALETLLVLLADRCRAAADAMSSRLFTHLEADRLFVGGPERP
jgi:uncharacterized circularly permuted ATP-grasp superfamily protein/uncharacterized alpha-E superfamily protein